MGKEEKNRKISKVTLWSKEAPQSKYLTLSDH